MYQNMIFFGSRRHDMAKALNHNWFKLVSSVLDDFACFICIFF